MANVQGWWELHTENTDSDSDAAIELSNADLEHIAELVREGYTEGEIVKDEPEDE